MQLDSLPTAVQEDIETFLLAVADDDFLMGDRLMVRWLSEGPTLEEDMALASIAQDEMGHARLWYEIVASSRDETVDNLAFERPTAARRNSILVERQFEDFADTIVRCFMYHEAEKVLLTSMSDGDIDEITSRADVALNEENYHREHAGLWLDRLTATEEARTRIKRAVETNALAAADMFAFEPEVVTSLTNQGALNDNVESLRAAWINQTSVRLSELDISIEEQAVRSRLETQANPNGRTGQHSESLEEVVQSHQEARTGRPA